MKVYATPKATPPLRMQASKNLILFELQSWSKLGSQDQLEIRYFCHTLDPRLKWKIRSDQLRILESGWDIFFDAVEFCKRGWSSKFGICVGNDVGVNDGNNSNDDDDDDNISVFDFSG